MAEEQEKVDFKKVTGLMDAVKAKFVEKYAGDAVMLVEDAEKIEAAHNKFQLWLQRLQDGDVKAITEYKKSRNKLETEDDFYFE